MIRALPKVDRRRVRYFARRQWRTVFIPFAILNVEGFGRSTVRWQHMETRWSDSHRRRLWRAPAVLLTEAH
ncbi:hypothetical protein NPJ82_05995 [Sphingomonas sp. NY01]|uniref:hypothetical protein n=1 Tax=Sphingomonas sp. NY01 TaxID=2968057 RepID=UPI00315D4F9D